MVLRFFATFSVLMLISCSTKIVTTTEKNPNCKTTICGNIHTPYPVTFTFEAILSPQIPSFDITFDGDKPFSFCIPPNLYKIKTIRFDPRPDYYFDSSFPTPHLVFKVKSGKNNYLGDLYIDSQVDSTSRIKIPCIRRFFKEEEKATPLDDLLGTVKKSKHYLNIVDAQPDTVSMRKSLIYIEE